MLSSWRRGCSDMSYFDTLLAARHLGELVLSEEPDADLQALIAALPRLRRVVVAPGAPDPCGMRVFTGRKPSSPRAVWAPLEDLPDPY